MDFLIGLARKDVTCFIPGVGMMGYGQPHNTVKEVATPLWARCLFLKDAQEDILILLHLELCFVTLAVKEEVLKRLQTLYPEWKLTEAKVLMTAQHTHSAPGGYSHYPFYNFTVPGFQLKIFETIVSGCVEAVQQSQKTLAAVKLSYGEWTIPEDKEVAFNRSMPAHLSNPDARARENHQAVDRRMRGIRFSDDDGKLKAVINWFGVHATSISSYNQRIHHDNKGIAADLFEKNYPGTMAFFLQGAAGDVSPNFIWDKKLKRMRGKFTDQYENAAMNGEIQFRESEKVPASTSLQGQIQSWHSYFDMCTVTTTPAHGVAFFQGTLEGPGVAKPVGALLRAASRWVRKVQLIRNPEAHRDFYQAQDPKDVLLDHRQGNFVGIPLKVWKSLPPLPDPTVEAFRRTARAQALETLPWVPTILPFQLVRIGPLLILALPGEITTIAAKRLETLIRKEVSSLPIEHVIISSYANAYMGYITTPEEYDLQSYEAGHTVYGRQTLEGITAGVMPLIRALKGEDLAPNQVMPFHFPPEELARRSY